MSFRKKITFSSGYQPPGGGYKYPQPGGGGVNPNHPPLEGGTSNDQTRVSPTVRKDERGGSYYEYMEVGHVMGKDNKQIRIDVDRDGGIFLDHGELAQLLEHDDIQNVIQQIDTQILTAKARYQQPGIDHRVK